MNYFIASVWMLSLVLPAWSGAGTVSPELQRTVQSLNPDTHVAIIITLRSKNAPAALVGEDRKARRSALLQQLRQTALASQSGLRKFLSSQGAKGEKDLWLINSLAVRVPAALVSRLANQPNVESVRLDATLTAPSPTVSVAEGAGWNLAMIKAPSLWTLGYTGQGIVVASMDTGVDSRHQDLGMRWRGGPNSWFDPHHEHTSPTDNNGHGTQTMGIAVGGSGIGVAPGAQWIAVKIFNDAGMTSLSSIHQGFQWLLDPDGNPATDDAPDIVNNSWGLLNSVGTCNTEFQPDLQALHAADIATIFSSGNDGPSSGTSLSPANNAGNLSVGAVDAAQAIASFSGRGPSACNAGIYPRIAAPGVNILTTDLSFGGIFPTATTTVSGTSFAAAHVTGALALLRSAHPAASVSQLEAAITQTAGDLGSIGPDNDFGYGLLDTTAASNVLSKGGLIPQPGELHFDLAAYTVLEEAGVINLTVTRTGGTDGAISVNYATANVTALAASDYLPTSGTLMFGNGQLRASFTVPLLDDASYEGNEFFSIALSNVTGGAALSSPSIVTLTIDDSADKPLDADGDGYPAITDCNDHNATIYPGAAEIKFDGIDQDCNGYDLTIRPIKAEYVSIKKRLIIEATSALGSQARLQVSGLGTMQWIPGLRLWRLKLTTQIPPALVVISGVEGSNTVKLLSR